MLGPSRVLVEYKEGEVYHSFSKEGLKQDQDSSLGVQAMGKERSSCSTSVSGERTLFDRDVYSRKERKKASSCPKKHYYLQLAKYLKKMHSVKTKGFGILDSSFTGSSQSWYKYVLGILEDLKGCVQEKKLTPGEARKIESEFRIVKSYFKSYATPRLLHGDIYRDNTMIFKGKLSGIIDAADAFSGDPMYEFGIIYSEEFDWNVISWMEQEYGSLNRHLIWVYAVLGSVWILKLVDKPVMIRGVQRRIRDLLQKRF